MGVIRRILAASAAAAALAAAQPAAQAADRLTLQLRWVTQAQFAGYYVAQAKGFYKAAGLEVTIRPGGPDASATQILAGGGADVITDWMPTALAAREKGVDLVNIAQPFKRSGMELTCRADSGVKTPADFKGKTLGVWFAGSEYPFLAWMARLGLRTDGTAGGVRVIKQGYNVDPLIQKQAACISTMSYNEYWQVLDAGFKPSQLVVFKYADQGVSTLEDGLWVSGARLRDPTYVNRFARFVAASMKGWEYAARHQAEAVQIVLDADTSGAQTEQHQTRMMAEIAKLVDMTHHGVLAPADYDRTVSILLSGGSTPVITKKPEGAWTHAVTDAAAKYYGK